MTLVQLLAKLSLYQSTLPQTKRNGSPRHRLAYLTEEHKAIAGHCLVYRLVLANNDGTVTLYQIDDINNEKIPRLRQAHGIPALINRRIEVLWTTETFEESFQRLYHTLKSIASRIPSVLQFQVQNIAQNNYLPPLKVI